MSERRAVVGWEGVYEVSEDGRVFRIVGGANNTFAGKELKPHLSNNGYVRIGLNSNRRQKQYSVHRLVATAFLENPNNLPQVNHKDSNRQNNHYLNLEWCNTKQNNQHAVENGRRDKTIKKRSKAVVGTHLVTGEQIEFSSTKEADRHGFSSGNISLCCRLKKYKSHKGYKWRYKNVWQCEWRKSVS